jgi:hypothetical protein
VDGGLGEGNSGEWGPADGEFFFFCELAGDLLVIILSLKEGEKFQTMFERNFKRVIFFSPIGFFLARKFSSSG